MGIAQAVRGATAGVGLLLLGLAQHGAALAQPALAQPSLGLGGDTVSWTVSAKPGEAVKPGGRVTLTLHGAVKDGWHVYGLKQLPTGPTPLQVSLESGDVAKAEGAPAGSPARTVHDPSFGLDTQYYDREFTVTAPARLGSRVAAGLQSIPVSVRFQTCNGSICQPPKTVRLSAQVNVRAG
jgi:hypothetical protein